MRNLRQHRHRSNRSNAYSESKSSNTQSFNPYYSEFALIRADRNPTTTITLSTGQIIDVYERPLRDTFIRPFTVADLETALKMVPPKYLVDLERIVLFGGTKKQELTANRLFRDGAYYPGWNLIALYPFLLKQMEYNCFRFAPHHLQEFHRAGVKIVQKRGKTFAQFDLESLKNYYLNIVLLHEIGHHVDWLRNRKKEEARLSEEFAEWFSLKIGGL